MRFVLVHGGSHGSWCWDRLVPELANLGHEVDTPELPGHGAHVDDVATIQTYRDAVVTRLRPGDVLVGHSLGCPVAVMAADAFPDLGHLTLLAGQLPIDGQPLYSVPPSESLPDPQRFPPSFLRVIDEGRRVEIADFEAAREYFYHDCSDELARWAFDRLTPQQVSVMNEEVVRPSRFWRSNVPRSYIQCTEDRVFPSWRSDREAARLGVVPLCISTSHSPFLSRPADLARLLVQATGTVPIGPLDSNP